MPPEALGSGQIPIEFIIARDDDTGEYWVNFDLPTPDGGVYRIKMSGQIAVITGDNLRFAGLAAINAGSPQTRWSA